MADRPSWFKVAFVLLCMLLVGVVLAPITALWEFLKNWTEMALDIDGVCAEIEGAANLDDKQ